MRHITNEGVDLIKHYEGFSSSPYLCPAAHWTIAYGAIWGLDGTRVTRSHPDVTKEQGDQLLRRDVGKSERAVLRLIRVPLSDGPVSYTHLRAHETREDRVLRGGG